MCVKFSGEVLQERAAHVREPERQTAPLPTAAPQTASSTDTQILSTLALHRSAPLLNSVSEASRFQMLILTEMV